MKPKFWVASAVVAALVLSIVVIVAMVTANRSGHPQAGVSPSPTPDDGRAACVELERVWQGVVPPEADVMLPIADAFRKTSNPRLQVHGQRLYDRLVLAQEVIKDPYAKYEEKTDAFYDARFAITDEGLDLIDACDEADFAFSAGEPPGQED